MKIFNSKIKFGIFVIFFFCSVIILYPSDRSLAISLSPKEQYFVSLKVSEANVRTGPGRKFPIKWIYVQAGIPLKVIDKFEHWYKVYDENHNEGWLHKSLLQSKRNFVTIDDEVKLYRNPRYNNSIIAILGSAVRGDILSCREKWCNVKIGGFIGWIKKENIWGVFDDEIIAS